MKFPKKNKELRRMKECREEKKEVKIRRREMEMGRDEEVLCGEWARVEATRHQGHKAIRQKLRSG